jgi:hypothetical protein
MSTENVTVTCVSVLLPSGRKVVLLDRCMTTHLLSFGFAAYEAFEDSGVNEKKQV